MKTLIKSNNDGCVQNIFSAVYGVTGISRQMLVS